jgi:hypothetical protein
MGNYDDIGVPVQGQPVSSGAYGIKVRNYLINADSRISSLENNRQQIIKRGRRITNTGSISTETGVLRLDGIPVYAGRLYQMSCGPVLVDGSVANDVARLTIRTETTGTATTSSAQLAIGQTIVPNISFPEGIYVNGIYAPATDATLSVLLSCSRQTGTGVFVVLGGSTTPVDLFVKDLGFDTGDAGVVL